jgi:hypothetical protein
LNANNGTNGYTDSLSKDHRHAGRTSSAKPEEFHFADWFVMSNEGTLLMLDDSQTIPAKQFAITKIKKAIGAVRIGTLGQHGRSGKKG